VNVRQDEIAQAVTLLRFEPIDQLLDQRVDAGAARIQPDVRAFVRRAPQVIQPLEFRAILRRRSEGAQPAAKLMRFGALEIDRDARTVTVGGKPCDLTSYQFDLLIALAERAGRVLTRDQIMEAVRGRELEAFDRSIDVHMGRIRAAIEVDAKNPKRILTVRGVGYVFAKQQD